MGRLATLWYRVRDSLWFIPTLLTALGAGLAFATVEVDRWLVATEQVDGVPLVFGGGVEGARGVLGAIAGGIITVTGVLFSVTIVALQLASTQFTPRVLRNFTSDRANQVVLGVFIGTFTYTLLVLRTIRSPLENTTAFVPAVSVSVALVLAVLSIGFLIFFIDHVARSIQASVIIDRVTNDSLELVHTLFPEQVGRPVREAVPPIPGDDTVSIVSEASGYLQSVDEDQLFQIAEDGGFVLHLDVAIGTFILPGHSLITAWPREGVDTAVADQIRDAMVLGFERTPYQDLEWTLVELVDIAVRALSPAVNDPTTATLCIDRLGEIITAMGRRGEPQHVRTGETGRVVFAAHPLTYEEAVAVAFDKIRHHGVDDSTVARRLLEMFASMGRLLPAERHPPLARQAALVLRRAERLIQAPEEREAVRAAAARAFRALRQGARPH